MKVFVLLCFVAVLAFAESQRCNGRNCSEGQCCLSGMVPRCVRLTALGGRCNYFQSCGCEEGLECRGAFWLQHCHKPSTTTTTESTTLPDVEVTETTTTEKPAEATEPTEATVSE